MAQPRTLLQDIGLYVFRREFLLAFAGMVQTPLSRRRTWNSCGILEHGYRIKAVVTELESTRSTLRKISKRVRGMLLMHGPS